MVTALHSLRHPFPTQSSLSFACSSPSISRPNSRRFNPSPPRNAASLVALGARLLFHRPRRPMRPSTLIHRSHAFSPPLSACYLCPHPLGLVLCCSFVAFCRAVRRSPSVAPFIFDRPEKSCELPICCGPAAASTEPNGTELDNAIATPLFATQHHSRIRAHLPHHCSLAAAPLFLRSAALRSASLRPFDVAASCPLPWRNRRPDRAARARGGSIAPA